MQAFNAESSIPKEAFPRPALGRREKMIARLRPWLERWGIAWLSRPALNDLDRKLEQLIPKCGGFFVEAGANDGVTQSNTYYLAKFRQWRGVLIEAFPHLAEHCMKVRPESVTVCCALGAPEVAGGQVKLRHAGLMSHICGTLGDVERERERAEKGQRVQGMEVHEGFIQAPLRTLTEVLEEAGAPVQFDLLSLDVEGHEVEVLRGLDFTRFRPTAICIEVLNTNVSAVEALLSSHYHLEAILHQNPEHADYFWRLKA